jgi:DNA-binding response OmpR family regulator
MVLIALTGWGQEQDRKRSREAGFDHHLVKPVDPKVLMTLVSELFQGQRLATLPNAEAQAARL